MRPVRCGANRLSHPAVSQYRLAGLADLGPVALQAAVSTEAGRAASGEGSVSSAEPELQESPITSEAAAAADIAAEAPPAVTQPEAAAEGTVEGTAGADDESTEN